MSEKVALSTTLQEDFGRLLKKLQLYRSVLQENDKEEFEFAWGSSNDDNALPPPGSIMTAAQGTSSVSKSLFNLFGEKTSPATQNMLFELGNVRSIVMREVGYFKNPSIDEEAKRKRLNLLFVKDLLDGVNGMILDHKDRRDNEKKNQVESWQKMMAGAVLLLSSTGMLYYVYLFAMLQSASRQHAWFNSFQVWLIVEVFVISTGLVLVEHVVIPLWSLKEVQRVKEKIVSDILSFQSKLKSVKRSKANPSDTSSSSSLCLIGDHDEHDPLSFNAAEFLFPSYRIARLFPKYSESQLILQYKTPWPKKSFKGREKSTKKRYDKRFEFIPKTIGRVGVFAVTNLIQLPPSIQEMGLQMLLLTLCAYVLKFHLLLYDIHPLLSLAPAGLLLTLVYVFFISGRRLRQRPTYPLQPSDDSSQHSQSAPHPPAPSASDHSRLCDAYQSLELAQHVASYDSSRESRSPHGSQFYMEDFLDSSSSPSSSSSLPSLHSIHWDEEELSSCFQCPSSSSSSSNAPAANSQEGSSCSSDRVWHGVSSGDEEDEDGEQKQGEGGIRIVIRMTGNSGSE